jgi:hypothetical protein
MRADYCTLELVKRPDHDDGTPRWVWLKFLKSRNQEELEMLAEKDPEVKKPRPD